jgi:hypothetical protein
MMMNSGKPYFKKEFWEELVGYFPLLRYGLRIKRKNKWGAHTYTQQNGLYL